MYELSFIRKYLTPKRKQLSVSLIAVLSVAVITLVVWLAILFLSVTEGIEKNWTQKLTALNAPVRLQPTSDYFSSYYYNVDLYSDASHYMAKTIGQKARALLSDPYNPDFDEEIPRTMARPDRNASGHLKDPVKGALACLEHLKDKFPGLAYQDVEHSGALLRLDMIRQEGNSPYPLEMQSQLTNVSYLASFPSHNPSLKELLLEPSAEDLNNLLFLTERSSEELGETLLQTSQIEKLKTKTDIWRLPIDLLPERTPFRVEAYRCNGEISHVVVPIHSQKSSKTTIERRGQRIFFQEPEEPEIPLDRAIPLFTMGSLEFDVLQAHSPSSFLVEGLIQKKKVGGTISLQGLQVAKAHFTTAFDKAPIHSPLWPYYHEGKWSLPEHGREMGILVAKNYRENGVKIGDKGSLSYSGPTATGTQEMQIPVYVSGFYDPGIMSVGNKCILVPPKVTQMINASNSAFTLEQSEANALYVWTPQLKDAQKVKESLLNQLEEMGIGKYWKVQTYKEYDFAKDLMQQFQSDKYLFTLIGLIILVVACTNIISLLVMLVSDKKKEIGILRAMGAKRRSVAAIFALCGGSLGLFSSLLGVFLAYITLKNIDGLVHLLSLLQGHEAFNAQFFGQSLPKELSPRALFFAGVATPLLALIAGLIPAIKAARLNPCDTLRSE